MEKEHFYCKVLILHLHTIYMNLKLRIVRIKLAIAWSTAGNSRILNYNFFLGITWNYNFNNTYK
jgi:hypothetical protein